MSTVASEPKGFREARAQAQTYLKDKDKTRQLIQEVFSKAYQHKQQLDTVWTDLISLLRMIRAWARGEYERLPRKTIIVAIAAVIYFLNPFDLVPVFIPGIGYLDDAAVIAFVLSSIRQDVHKFLDWESQKNESCSVA